jgi:hypothetical protein
MTELANIPSAKEQKPGRPPRVYGPAPDTIHIYGTGASGLRERLVTRNLRVRAKGHKDGACPCLNCTMQRSICAADKAAVCAHQDDNPQVQ